MRKKFLIYVIVLIIFLSNGLIFAQQIPSSPTLFNTLRSINASNGQSGEIVVKLTLDQTLPVTPVGVSLNNPSRIYFDLNQVGSGLGKNYQETLEGDLRSINVVQVGDRTRVVLNLVKPMQHDIQMRDNVLLVKLVASPAKETRASPIRIVEASSQKQINTLRDVDFRRGTLGEGRVMVDMTKTNANVDVKQQGDVILVDFANTSLPDNLVRRLDVLDFATPIQTIETTRAGDNVRMVVKPHGRWEHSARQSGSQFILEVRALSNDEEEIEKRKRATGGYTGERLSLNFQDVEVRAILQVIADFTNINIIASDSVGGNLTLRLKDVPWDQALDIVLQVHGLDKRRAGNVIFVAPRKEMADRELLDLEAQLQIAEMEPLRSEIFHLNHRRVNSVSFEGMLSKRGTITLDEISNTVTITDIPTRLTEIRKRIERLDVYERQVMIEARIVEAVDTFSRSLGARFGVQNATNLGSQGLGISGNLAGSSTLAGGGPNAGPNNLNVNLPAAAATGLLGGPAALGLSLMKINNGRLINLELSALETDNKGKVIASPRVVTAHGIEAIIEQGDRIPYQQATSSGATSIRFMDATLKLKVKPLITYNGQIDMELSVNQDRIGAPLNQFLPPPINTKQVTTKILVENGGTVVIGGIFGREENVVVNKVPLLGDIPVIGHLFRNTVRVDNKRELLIFVTPRILSETMNIQ
ncbi:MAG TPA: type IV pilus secretin PilQ [Nitrosomonas sp.]|nr:type IV pilus secretin PilQ [Nitrosomonas sp.]HQX13140.1 type IV pilus secretin PilQ [Nitrosomonas sp.]HRB32670.1 type IV pilus secretin PilQ [Nitrosomonas sp.]HRB45069.1 type IV pilus secretin PilQ [Nitrosomonas sp.]HRB77390.1 type IV pilus secretin PilQ [Nitrosomonas sp.]